MRGITPLALSSDRHRQKAENLYVSRFCWTIKMYRFNAYERHVKFNFTL